MGGGVGFGLNGKHVVWRTCWSQNSRIKTRRRYRNHDVQNGRCGSRSGSCFCPDGIGNPGGDTGRHSSTHAGARNRRSTASHRTGAGSGSAVLRLGASATVVSGAVGGLVYDLISLEGNIERPHRPNKDEVKDLPFAVWSNLFDLGTTARVFIGGTAAVAVFLILSPSTTFALVATGILAGSAGISVFRALQERLLAALVQRDAENARNTAALQNDFVSQAAKTAREGTNAVVSLSTMSDASIGESERKAMHGASSRLKEVEELLAKAMGAYDTLGNE